ncbi:FecR family protein [uncultured Parabacteroides sp.]|uniref:FecR family protein n=1 Tax=uncultured Parabacteroides sp. TaxID=512312 RepID=UPI0025FD4E26|nr:FecR family protein [uncultured Parabacteroides sp.]
MENDNNIKRIIQLYFGKHFSRSGRVLFGRWLRAEGGASEKIDMLQAFWEQSSAEATAETREDWDVLQRHLQLEPVRRNTVPMYRGWIKYAAVIALMLLTGAATFFVTDRLKPARHVEMAELFVPYGESRQVILPDSSRVWVDAGSLLVYPKDFADAETRTVYLTGEASFSVQKNVEKPFIVKTTYLAVQALGTVFTVASYPSDSCTSTILEQGSIKVDVRSGEHQSAILKPNEQLIYSHTEHTVTVQPVDALLYKMKRSGYQIYENVSFSLLMASLERKFNVTIHYNSQKYAGEYYNVKFAPHETLEDVLNVLQQLVGIRYKIKGNVVFIN